MGHPHDDETAASPSATRTFTLDGPPGGFFAPRVPDLPLPDRYEDHGFLGSGAMGEVRRVLDRHLGAMVAMKILRPEVGNQQAVKVRFELEARVTARLRHPAIVAVHDTGTLADGRVWFTMEIVEGRTFKEVIDSVHEARANYHWRATRDGWTLRRLVKALRSVCDAMALAHSRGVVHRDLKPRNIMIGAHGEVKVMDWGIARGVDFDLVGLGEGVFSLVSEHRTAIGRVVGTPAYMSPEQARGERDLSPASDVYALGAILYQILTGKAPYEGKPEEVLRQVIAGRPRAAVDALGQPAPVLPPGLVTLLEACMAPEPAARPANAGALRDALQTWLGSDERRELAQGALVKVADRKKELARVQSEGDALGSAAAAALAAMPDSAPIVAKVPGWQLEELARQRRIEVARGRVEVEEVLWAAFAIAGDDPEVRGLVAQEQADALAEAEDAGDAEGALDRVMWLRDLAVPKFLHLINDEVDVELPLDRNDAVVRVFGPVERGGLRHWELRDVLSPGTRRIKLAPGSWLFSVNAPDCEEVLVPALVTRTRPWVRAGPGESEARPIRLPRGGTVPADMVYVPATWSWLGDESAPGSFTRRRIWTDGFLIGRHPVSIRDWGTCLRDVWTAGRSDLDALMVVRSYPFDSLFLLDPIRGPYLAVPEASLDAPVEVPARRAVEIYLDWRRDRDGLAWRLPDELEWEAAARGVDGSPYPWGRNFDPTFANVDGGKGAPRFSPRSFLADQSVYGVQSMIGGEREWTSTPVSRPPPAHGQRLIPAQSVPESPVRRGGSFWTRPPYTLAARRALEGSQSALVRLACSWEPG